MLRGFQGQRAGAKPSPYVVKPRENLFGGAAAELELLSAGQGESRFEAVRDAGRDETRNIAAQAADLLHEAGGDELHPLRGHQEHRLHIRVQPPVHAGHLELVLEVRHGAQAPDQHAGVHRGGEMHQERIERPHLDFETFGEQRTNFVLYGFDPLIGREQRTLAGVAGHRDDQMIDDAERTFDDVHMSVRDGVERARVNADSRLHRFSLHFWKMVSYSEGSEEASSSASPSLPSLLPESSPLPDSSSTRATEPPCSSGRP